MPFDSALTTKISPLIDGQVPDFIQADHPIFVQFLEAYYKFLESGELTILGTVDQILLETVSTNYLVLNGTNFGGLNEYDRIVFESGSGTTGKFENGETIIGATSKASSTVLVEDDERLFISANQRFEIGETITGQTSGATSEVVKYRANPVQSIQQLLDYVNPDNTVDHFFTAFRDSFMESIPESLATGVSKRNLVKQIRDLYAAKGTSEGHKLFFRILLNEEATVSYPAKFMMRMSDGNWNVPTIIRATLDTSGVDASQMQGQEIEGASSGTKAQIISVNAFNQGSDAVVEFGLRDDSIDGAGFSLSEIFTGTDLTSDVSMQFTIQGIISGSIINSGGILYNVGDDVTLDTSIGNGQALAKVGAVGTGNITDIIIEEIGKNYRVGDAVKFTNDAVDLNVSIASAFVSVVGGRLLTEDTTSTTITLENNTREGFTPQKLLLDGTSSIGAVGEPYQVFGTDRRYSTTQGYYYPLYRTKARAAAANTTTGLAHAHLFDEFPDLTFYMPGDNNNHTKTEQSTLYDLFRGDGPVEDNGFETLLEDDTNGGVILQEEEALQRDVYKTPTDGIVLEAGVYAGDEATEINRIYLVSGGNGYSALPSLTVSSKNGTEAELIPVTNNIGNVTSLQITDSGFKYNSVPDVKFDTNLIVKDVYGTFSAGSQLSSHTGTVKSYDNATKRLAVDIEPISSFSLEQSTSYNERFQLENFDIVEPGRPDHGPINTIYNVLEEKEIRFDLNAYTEEEIQIVLENEIGVVQSDAFQIDSDQISLERDLDIAIEFGIRLESGSAIPSDEDGRFLLDGHLNRITQRSSDDQALEFHFDLEDASQETNIFGQQESGILLFDNSVDDVDDNINLEPFKFRMKFEDATDTADVHGTFLLYEDETDIAELEDGTDGNLLENDRITSLNGGSSVIMEVSTENAGDFLLLDGSFLSSSDSEDKVEAEIYTTQQFPDNHSSIVLEDTTDILVPNFLVNEGIGNALVLNKSSTVTDLLTNNFIGDGSRLLLDDEKPVEDTTISYGQSIKHANTPDSRLLGEGLETFITERSAGDVKEKGKVLYDQIIFSSDNGALDGDARAGELITEEGEFIISETSGVNIILDGVDSSGTDAGGFLLGEDEELGDNLVLNGTTSTSTDESDDLINEAEFSLLDERISDGGGAFGTIVQQGTANATITVGTTAVQAGSYLNTDSLLSESVIRIQDSYFYQAFSYEVSVSSVLSSYINELKRAVHPAGFIPFGKVSLASEISVRVGTTGSGLIDYTGDDTFSPEFASLFNLIFDEKINTKTFVREGPGVLDPNGGSTVFDKIVQENGTAIGDKLLEETDGDNLQFEGNIDIAIENSPSHSDGVVLLDSGVGGKLLSETAIGENTLGKKSLTHITKIRVRPEIKTTRAGYGAPLLSGILPGSVFFDPPTIQLEDGLRDKLPAIMRDNLVLDGTDTLGTNAGDRISEEQNPNEQSGVQINDVGNFSVKDLVELNTIGFIEGRSDDGNYSDVPEGGIVFEQSAASDELVLEDFLQFITEDGDNLDLETETDTGLLIGEGIQVGDNSVNIILDGQLNRGEKILTEGSKIEFEDTTDKGSIPEGNFGNRNITQYTREARINTEIVANRLSLQDEFELDLEVGLEDGTGSIIFDGTSAVLDIEGNILLDGTDSGKSDAGDALVQDTSANENDNVLLDSTGGRDLGDKLIMFSTLRNQVADNEGGFFLLSGTDGDSTNDGDEILLESDATGEGTLRFLQQNSINIANGLVGESGGLQLPISEADAGEGQVLITTFDSSIGTFDSTQTTFDAA